MLTIFEYLQHGRTELSDEALSVNMWQQFGSERTVVVLDMSEFTQSSRQHGIVYFLLLIQQMRDITAPLVAKWSGQVVKYEADNLFAAFTDPFSAMQFLVDAFQSVAEFNASVDSGTKIALCAGVDHGQILMDDHDYFGDAVNIASKLGEDVARANEVLVSETVQQSLPNDQFRFEKIRDHGLAGVPATVYQLKLSD